MFIVVTDLIIDTRTYNPCGLAVESVLVIYIYLSSSIMSCIENGCQDIYSHTVVKMVNNEFLPHSMYCHLPTIDISDLANSNIWLQPVDVREFLVPLCIPYPIRISIDLYSNLIPAIVTLLFVCINYICSFRA